jgi:hypothetical protein
MSLEDIFGFNLSDTVKQAIEKHVEDIVQRVIEANSGIPANRRPYVGITQPVGLKPYLQLALHDVRRRLIKDGLTEQDAKAAVTFIMLRDYTLQKMTESAERGKKIPKTYLRFIGTVTV